MAQRAGTQWAVVVAVKQLSAAKSRLALPERERGELALAMMSDTLLALAGVPGLECLIVTDDPQATALASAVGMTVRGREPGGGLNAALTYGARLARTLWGDVPVATLPADLPALQSAELREALAAASNHDQAFVADAGGDGTTLLFATGALLARYGSGSAQRHRAGGSVPLTGDWPGLRRDVDTLADLTAALVIGVGPHTSAVHARLA